MFSSPFILAQRTKCKIVPIAPFYEFGSDVIHMNFGSPINLNDFDNKKDALMYLRDVLATTVYENMKKYSTPYVRSINKDIHIEYMVQRKKEYLKNSWTKDVWDEELTQYLDSDDKEYNSVMESYDLINVNQQNASIIAPCLVKRLEHKKYNFNYYMHKNWDK